MNIWPRYPSIYEINTQVWLAELNKCTGRRITLGNIPAAELEAIASQGFDAIWLMGVWQRSPGACDVARKHPEIRKACQEALPGMEDADMIGSPYAVQAYSVAREFGGNRALAAFRRSLKDHGMKLILDYVPNHLALDHSWISQYPERFVHGTEEDLQRQPDAWFRAPNGHILAHGRDPFFPAWTDTAQLDYRSQAVRNAMAQVLVTVAARCDGVRCDMAMLETRAEFCRTWGGDFDNPGAEFWPEAIRKTKMKYPNFLMIAEVYWDLEYELQQQGFDYTYDRRLYDRLLRDNARSIRVHLGAGMNYQQRLLRFIENHDEMRAAFALGPEKARAAAVAALTAPGARLLYQGQLQGCRCRWPVQLRCRMPEPADPACEAFYRRLLDTLRSSIFRNGTWRLITPRPAHDGDASWEDFLIYLWTLGSEHRLVAVNYAGAPGRCFVPLAGMDGVAQHDWYFDDALSGARYQRHGTDLDERGLYLAMPAYGFHVFNVHRSPFAALARYAGHKEGIYCLACAPDGLRVASAGKACEIHIWDATNGNCLQLLRGHTDTVAALAWSPDGRLLASSSDDHTVRIWDWQSGRLLMTFCGHSDHVLTIAWSPDGKILASGSIDRLVYLWHLDGQQQAGVLRDHGDAVNSLAWSPSGNLLASGCGDQVIRIWDVESLTLNVALKGHDWVSSIMWSPSEQIIASGTGRGTIDIWNLKTNTIGWYCEGHTERVLSVAFSPDGSMLASKSSDGTIRFWKSGSWKEMGWLPEAGHYLGGLAFLPGSSRLISRDDKQDHLQVWHVDKTSLLDASTACASVQYASARVVVVGHQSAGKSCLIDVLMGKSFKPHPATHAMRVFRFDTGTTYTQEGQLTREIFLWDLAGQRNYCIVNQLFLERTTVGVIVFDASDVHNPYFRVGYWSRALRKIAGPDCPQILVAGRVDVSTPAVTDAQAAAFCQSNGLDAYITTSASTGRGLRELQAAIRDKIDWERVSVANSPNLWRDVRSYLLAHRHDIPVLLRVAELCALFEKDHPGTRVEPADLEAILINAQIQGLIWRFSFGDYILMQPELINTYGSALVDAAQAHPEGLGALKERDVVNANIHFSEIKRLESETERLLLHAVVELFLKRELVMLEGEYLVFPCNLLREKTELPTGVAPDVIYSFDGPVEQIYATLVVRLFYCGSFLKRDLWKSGAEFQCFTGKICGFLLDQCDEGHGELSIYFDEDTPTEAKVLFLQFIHEHIKLRAIPGTIKRSRRYRCHHCGHPVADLDAVAYHVSQGDSYIPCAFCMTHVPLSDVIESRFSNDDLVNHVKNLDREIDDKREQAVGQATLRAKQEIGDVDVFIAYNHEDKEQVVELAETLKSHGVNPWFDREIVPGVPFAAEIQSAIDNAKATAIILGKSGIGNWQQLEVNSCVDQYAKERKPLIPVLLPGVTELPALPFIRQFNWVSFQERVDEPEAISQLVAGIRGAFPGNDDVASANT